MPDASDPTFCVSIYINKMQKLGSDYAHTSDASDPTFCVRKDINKMHIKSKLRQTMPDASDPTFCVIRYINKMHIKSKLRQTMPDASDPTFCVIRYINKMQRSVSKTVICEGPWRGRYICNDGVVVDTLCILYNEASPPLTYTYNSPQM